MATSKNKPDETDFFDLVGYTFRLLGDSWIALRLNIYTFILVALVPGLVIGLAVPFALVPIFTHGNIRTISIIAAVLIFLAALAIACIFLPAMTLTQLASVRGKKFDFKEAFNKSKPFFLRFIGLIILITLSVVVGFVLFIIPGILAAFFLSMSTYIMIDKNTGVVEAMKQSYRLVKLNWLTVLALFVVNIAVSIVSYLPLIGWLAGLVLGIMYFCLPAIVYTNISKKQTR